MILLMFLLLATPAFAHDMYKDWKQEHGASCCDNRDCAPVDERIKDGSYEAFFNNKWVKIPDNKVRKEPSPDGRAHLCANQLDYGHVIVYCFQPGFGT